MESILDLFRASEPLFVSTVALFSLFVGSFLNVVIHRLPIMMENAWRRECAELLDCDTKASGSNSSLDQPFNLVVPRSRCPACNSPVKAWQNIPVLSYVILGGKCSSCKAPISLQYPAVEIVTALLSALVAIKFGVSLQTVAGVLLTWSLVALTVIDFKSTLLPDDITLPMVWLGLIMSLVPVFVGAPEAIVGAAVGYLSLWSVYQLFKLVTGKEGMGYGDFKLMAVFGAWFGWQALPSIILLSSVVGAAVGITLVLTLGRDKNVPIPFGPYLAAAGWLAMLYGDNLKALYFP